MDPRIGSDLLITECAGLTSFTAALPNHSRPHLQPSWDLNQLHQIPELGTKQAEVNTMDFTCSPPRLGHKHCKFPLQPPPDPSTGPQRQPTRSSGDGVTVSTLTPKSTPTPSFWSWSFPSLYLMPISPQSFNSLNSQIFDNS